MVLFLDVDGVLNHRAVFVPGSGTAVLCPEACRRLREFVGRVGCKVVLSSTWRMFRPGDRHHERLREHGVFDNAHDDWRTVELPNDFSKSKLIFSRRGDEIAEWLSRHPEVTAYAIIDDDADMLPEQKPRFVQTAFDTGLTDEHIAALERILTP